MKRLILDIFCLAMLLCLLVGCTAGQVQASLLEFVGEPVIWSAKNEEAMSPKVGMRLQQNDSIKTTATDNAWLRFGVDQTTMLGEDSELVLLPENTQPSCELRTGLLLCRIDKPLKNEQLFCVQTADALLETKSAVFSVELMPEGDLSVNVFQGEVALITTNASITLTKGKAVQLAADAGVPTQPPAAIDYNALPASLAACIGDYAREALLKEDAALSASSSPWSGAESEPTSEATDGTRDGQPLPQSSSSMPPESSASSAPSSSNSASVPPPVSTGSGSSSLPDLVDLETDGPTSHQPAQVTFSYQWYENSYKPFADIRWKPGGEKSYIDWQLCDSRGRAIGASGRIDCPSGSMSENNYRFDVSSPSGNNLFPKGYNLLLTAYVVTDNNRTALNPIIMQLPYFEMHEDEDGAPIPDTNIGVYFVHSYGGITILQQQDNLLVTGKLPPLKGRNVPLELRLTFE